MPYRYGKRKAIRAKRPVKRILRKRSGGRKAITKIVQSVIHRNVENKTFQYNSGIVSVVNYNNLSWGSLGWGNPLSPYTSFLDVPIGTGSGARIGNSIQCRKLTFKGTLYPAPYNASTNTQPMPQEVRFWIVHDKSNPCVAPPSGAWTSFFQNGSSSSTFSSNLIDMVAQVNTDRYVVHATRTFKVGYSNNAGTGGQAGAQYFANNDFKLNHKFNIDLTKFMVKNIKYNDASQVPTTRGLFLIVEAVRADGTSSSGGQASEIPVLMQYQLCLTYEDA